MLHAAAYSKVHLPGYCYDLHHLITDFIRLCCSKQLNKMCFEMNNAVSDRLCSVGFGSLCIIPQLLFPFLLSEALMGMAFPLFVLVACEADPQARYEEGDHCLCTA